MKLLTVLYPKKKKTESMKCPEQTIEPVYSTFVLQIFRMFQKFHLTHGNM